MKPPAVKVRCLVGLKLFPASGGRSIPLLWTLLLYAVLFPDLRGLIYPLNVKHVFSFFVGSNFDKNALHKAIKMKT